MLRPVTQPGDITCLSLNEENAPNGHIVIGRYYNAARTFVPAITGVNAIKVVGSRPDATNPPAGAFLGPDLRRYNARLSRMAIVINLEQDRAAF